MHVMTVTVITVIIEIEMHSTEYGTIDQRILNLILSNLFFIN